MTNEQMLTMLFGDELIYVYRTMHHEFKTNLEKMYGYYKGRHNFYGTDPMLEWHEFEHNAKAFLAALNTRFRPMSLDGA